MLIITTLISLFTTVSSFDYSAFETNFKSNYIAKTDIHTLEIPFTTQAPFAEWDDPRQQDGCEEASVLMVYHWLTGENLPPEKAKKTILEIASFEEKTYGNYVDTSAQDTAQIILKEYFGYTKYTVKKLFKTEDLIFELALGNAIIIPANGQLLQNPYFTPPGPERHMLVIKGYDKETQEFITNDPGTKMGESYRYDEDILFKAIADYPTGDHKPIEKEEKIIIVVKR